MIAFLVALSALLLSVPFLVPRLGFLVLIAFVPLLCAERSLRNRDEAVLDLALLDVRALECRDDILGVQCHCRRGIFAVLANALQMSLIFGLFGGAGNIFMEPFRTCS